MRARDVVWSIATFGVVVAAAVAAYVGNRGWQQLGPQWLVFLADGGAPAIRGLVREEDVHPDLHEDDIAELRTRLQARETRGFFAAAAERFSTSLSRLLRLPELDRQREVDRQERPYRHNEGSIADRRAGAFTLEFRGIVRESFTLAAFMLKIVGALLVFLVPMTLLAYGLLEVPLRVGVPIQMGCISRVLDSIAKPMDVRARPILAWAARRVGMAESELLLEESTGSVTEAMPPADGVAVTDHAVVDVVQVSKRFKRVLLGLLVLDVVVSAMAFAALLVLVMVLQLAGLLGP